MARYWSEEESKARYVDCWHRNRRRRLGRVADDADGHAVQIMAALFTGTVQGLQRRQGCTDAERLTDLAQEAQAFAAAWSEVTAIRTGETDERDQR